MRFLHTSDWQLGMTRRFFTAEAGPRFAQARLDAVGRIAELANQLDVDFTVVAGDVFEHDLIERPTIVRACEELSRFDRPVLILPGNHDCLGPGGVWESDHWQRHRPQQVEVIAASGLVRPGAVPGVEIVAGPWTAKDARTNPIEPALKTLEQIGPPEEGAERIGLVHGAIPVPGYEAEHVTGAEIGAALAAACAAGRLSYVAMGDRHSMTKVTERIWYSGTPEPTAARETDPGMVLEVELGDVPVVTPHRVGTWRLVDKLWEIDGPEDLDHLEDWLDELPDKSRTHIRLGVAGAVNAADLARLETLVDAAAELFAGVTPWVGRWNPRVIAESGDLDAIAVSGPDRDAAAELAAAAGDGDPDAARALALLHRLSAAAG